MAGLSVTTKTLVGKTKAYPADVGTTVKELENSGSPLAVKTANALRNIQSNLDGIQSILRNNNPEVTQIVVRDTTGKVVGVIGDFEFNGIAYRNYFSEIHIGDPFGTGNPADAVINVNPNGQITIGSTGYVDVLDPYGTSAAWIGTQFDTLAVTGAVTSGGLIRLTVPGHAFVTGDSAIVLNVGGVPNAVGTFVLTKIDATHVDLQASVFTGTYTSGGTITRLLHVTGAVAATGLIRLTVTAHGYESGDKVNVGNVGGVPNATGQWVITVITANTFDLVGSTFAGAYTTGGTAIRYFAGGLFQQIAVGPSFPNYRLRAFPDGTLKIRDSEIILNGSSATIDLDPTTGKITVTEAGGGRRVTIGGIGITLDDSTGVPADLITLTPSSIQLSSNNANAYQINMSTGGGLSLYAPTGSFALSKVLDLYGYSAGSGFGPLISTTQFRGSGASPTASNNGDTLGGLVSYGYDGSGESDYAGGIRVVSTENHGATNHGAKLVFEVTATGAAITSNPMTLDQDGTLNVGIGYKVGGVAGIAASRTRGVSLTVTTIANGIKGTPGAGQTAQTVVTGVSLNVTSDTFTGGLLTA